MTINPALTAAAGRQLSVVVASRNPVKINAVAAALQRALPDVQHTVQGADSQSGVPDQPFGDEETLLGACNRVQSIETPQHKHSLLVAIEGGVGVVPPLPVGTLAAGTGSRASAPHARQPLLAANQQWRRQQPWEASQQQRPGVKPPAAAPVQQQDQQLLQLECFAWVVAKAPSGAISQARTASFPLPLAVTELMLRQGMELGAADDAVFGRVKSGRGSGTIGQLTAGLITRASYYEHAVLCALGIPLLNPSLYPGFSDVLS